MSLKEIVICTQQSVHLKQFMYLLKNNFYITTGQFTPRLKENIKGRFCILSFYRNRHYCITSLKTNVKIEKNQQEEELKTKMEYQSNLCRNTTLINERDRFTTQLTFYLDKKWPYIICLQHFVDIEKLHLKKIYIDIL